MPAAPGSSSRMALWPRKKWWSNCWEWISIRPGAGPKKWSLDWSLLVDGSDTGPNFLVVDCYYTSVYLLEAECFRLMDQSAATSWNPSWIVGRRSWVVSEMDRPCGSHLSTTSCHSAKNCQGTGQLSELRFDGTDKQIWATWRFCETC